MHTIVIYFQSTYRHVIGLHTQCRLEFDMFRQFYKSQDLMNKLHVVENSDLEKSQAQEKTSKG